jgi:hypothetical protein
MSMRKSTRQELRKTREILRFVLRGKYCYFHGRKRHPDCPGLLVSTESYAKDGDGQGSPVRSITIHHKDGNHDNDDDRNKALCHDPCHRRHHALERARVKRQEAL